MSIIERKSEVDNRSVYVGNVEYGATAEELHHHFGHCGGINRITIPCNPYTSQPKGFAYIEFEDMDAVQSAIDMDNSIFKGRPIKVNPKRTNFPGVSTTNRPPRGRRGVPSTRGPGLREPFTGPDARHY